VWGGPTPGAVADGMLDDGDAVADENRFWPVAAEELGYGR
jgi:hypothetical protein